MNKRPILLISPLLLAAISVAAQDVSTREGLAPAAGGAHVVAYNLEGDLQADFDRLSQEKTAEFVKKAFERYEAADFAAAVDLLNRAIRLDSGNAQIAAHMKEAQTKLQQQAEALKALPVEPAARAAAVQSRFNQGAQLEAQGNWKDAYAAYYDVWLVGGVSPQVAPARVQLKALAGKLRGQQAGVTADASKPDASKPVVPPSPAVAVEAKPAPDLNAIAAQPEIKRIIDRAEGLLAAGEYDRAEAAFRELTVQQAEARELGRAGIERVRQARTGGPAVASSAPAAPAPAANDRDIQQRVQAALNQARQAEASSQWETAAALYQQVAVLDPANAEAKSGLDALSERLNAPGGVEGVNPRENQVARLLQGGEEALLQGDHRTARALYAQAIELDPANASARSGLSRAETAAQQTAAAQTSERERREQVRAMLTRAQALAASGQHDSALNTLQEVLRLDPSNDEAPTAIAAVTTAQARAREQAAEAERADQDAQRRQMADGMTAEGRRLLAAGDADAARAAFGKALELDGDNPDALAGLRDVEAREKSAVASAQGAAPGKTQTIESQMAPTVQQEPAPPPRIEPKSTVPTLQADTEGKKVTLNVLNPAEPAAAPAAYGPPAPAPAAVMLPPREEANQDGGQPVDLERAQMDRLLVSAERHFNEGQIDQAESAYQTLLGIQPDNPQALAGLDRIRSVKREGLTDADRLRQDEIRGLLEEARHLLANGKQDEAAKVYASVQSVDPTNQEARVALQGDLSGMRELDARLRSEPSDRPMSASVFENAIPVDAESRSTLAESYKTEGEILANRGEYAEALKRFEMARLYDPDDRLLDVQISQARQAAQGMQTAQAGSAPAGTARSEMIADRAEALIDEAFDLQDQGDLGAARDRMLEVQAFDPDNEAARTFLEQTDEDWARLEADRRVVAEADAKSAAGLEKLRHPVTIETQRPTPVSDFLNTVSLATGINYFVAPEVGAMVNVKLTDTPLEELLDTVLPPVGLKWRLQGDVVIVEADLQSRSYRLGRESLANLKALISNGQFQKILWPPDGEPQVGGQEYLLEEASLTLMVTDSARTLERVESFLGELNQQPSPEPIFRTYTLRANAEKVKSLLETTLRATSDRPVGLEPKFFLQDNELLVRALQEDVVRIEELLLAEDFMEKVFSNKLAIEQFSLVPRESLQANPEQQQQFFKHVVEQIKTFLYSVDGVQQAALEGRKMWEDPNTMSVTITDYPDTLRAIGRFIGSLDQLEKKDDFAILDLRYVKAEDMESDLRNWFGLTSSDTGPSGPQYNVRRSLRVDQDFTFRDLQLLLRRVNANNVADDRDDSVEIVVRVGTTSETAILREYDSYFVGDYEVIAEDISPSGVPGEGRANIQVRFIPPPGQAAGGGGDGEPGDLEQVQQAAEEAPTLDIQSFGNLNKLIVRYQNPADLQAIEELIAQLDFPVPQVEIETKLVEVNEQRAKEFSADWTLNNITEGAIELGNSLLNSRFAQDLDEFISEFEPGVEDANNANLLKNVTVINLVTGGVTPLNLELRMLEADGIVNVVNGPRITVLNGETGEFTISRLVTATNVGGFNNQQGTGGGIGTGTGDGGGGTPTPADGQQQVPIPNQQQQQQQIPGQQGQVGGLGFGSQSVDMAVTPEVTSNDSIEITIDTLVLTDDDVNLGSVVQLANPDIQGLGPQAVLNTGLLLGQRQKDLVTVARVASGGTIVLGGWTQERNYQGTSGVPVLRNIPYIGKLFFSRNRAGLTRTNLLVFLTVRLQEYANPA